MFHVTERLLLRPAWPEDAHALFGAIADKGVVRNLARAPWPYSLDHACEFIMRGQDPFLPSFLLTQPGPQGSQLVGCAGLSEGEDGIEIGYWIARPFWGRGFATEGALGILAIARILGHHQISAGHFTDNPASGRVLRKLGFRPTGKVVPRHSCGRGRMAECVLYRLDLRETTSFPKKAA